MTNVQAINVKEAFKPFKKCVARMPHGVQNELLDCYMYMGHDEEGARYKHWRTREYITITESGQLLKGQLQGE